MQGCLYEEGSFGVFLLVTVVLGGGAAALAGRAIAQTWRPWWQIVAYMLILGCRRALLPFRPVRGHAVVAALLFGRQPRSASLAGLAGFRAERRAQMVKQYRWINEPAGPLSWRRRAP